MPKTLPLEFFDRPVLDVAKELIGASLVRRLPAGDTITSMLTEVEAYDGPKIWPLMPQEAGRRAPK